MVIKMKIQGCKGFTLVEVIVGIALLGIIAVSILPFISYGYIQVAHSGSKTNALYTTQEGVEKVLDGETDTNTTSANQNLTITFTVGGSPVNIVVPGKKVQTQVTYDSNGNKTLVKAFKPN